MAGLAWVLTRGIDVLTLDCSAFAISTGRIIIDNSQHIGVIGSGQLGGAIVRGWLKSGLMKPEQLWLASRTGQRGGFETWPGINFTTSNQAAADNCAVVLLAVPPAQIDNLGLRLQDHLLLSVMAGVTIRDLARHTGAHRVIRAMSNPAADIGLAYSPWCASAAVTDEDRAAVQNLLKACGESDEVGDEAQIDVFTALTGPVPGLVAFYADCMVRYASERGVDSAIAERAVRQLFHASGIVLGQGDPSPGAHVQAMIDYAGTTAAALDMLRASTVPQSIADALDAAIARAGTISGAN